MTKIEQILESYKLKKTKFRLELLELFFLSDFPLSFNDIRIKILSTKDKVTIYRGLNIFEKKGLIHKVPVLDESKNTAYALLKTDRKNIENKQEHAHFMCLDCNKTFCIYQLDFFFNQEGLKEFEVQSFNITLKGRCRNTNICGQT